MTDGDVKILLVDDQQMTRQGLRQLIAAKAGLTVVGEAINSDSAIEQIRISAPQLVLMNIDQTKDESSAESTRRILAKFAAVKVIALSSESELKYVLQALHAGVSGYVLKKHGFEELIRAIQMVMNYDCYLAPEISAVMIRCFMKSYFGGIHAPEGAALSDR